MPYGLYMSAAGAEVQNQRLQVISNNLANVNTPGFKRELAIPQARHSEAIERGIDRPGSRSINDVGGGVRMRETVTEFSAGRLRRTENPTDAAIVDAPGQEKAFFVVQKGEQQFLTRAGNFNIAPNGELLTQQGFQVLSLDGNPVTAVPGLPADITKKGALRQGALEIPLQIVRPQSLDNLVRSGENLFSPQGEPTPVPFAERHVEGGYLELSSVNPTNEMMQLIEASRAYESNVKLIQHQDNMLGTLLNRVLRQ